MREHDAVRNLRYPAMPLLVIGPARMSLPERNADIA
jgi:hypothetical protein